MNSGSCERAFSDFGISHTKLRNKLNVEKVHKTSVVKMDQHQSHLEAGLLYTHRKHKFGVDDKPSPAPVDVNETYEDT